MSSNPDENNTDLNGEGENQNTAIPVQPENNNNNGPNDSNFDQNELVVLDPSHPLMSRFQNALKAQLTKQKEDLDQELREVSDSCKRHKQERENIGVLLYGVQQELAKQQTELEYVSDQNETEKNAREKAEKDLSAQRSIFEKATEELFAQRKSNQELQLQIEQLNQKIIYMEDAKKNVHADVRTLYRATTKAGVELAAAELDKKRQDIFVDRLTIRVENLTEEKQKYEAQLRIQEKETAAYREMLSDARTEIEAIELDRKRLMQQWDSSIITMRKRDEYYKLKRQEYDELKMNRQSTEMEIIGLKKNILQSQQENERLTGQYQRVEGDAAASKRKLAELDREKDNLLKKYSELLKVHNQTEEQLKSSEIEKAALESKNKVIDREIEKQHNINKALELSITQFIQDKATAKAASGALNRELTAIRQKRRDLEAELAKSDNTIIRDALECTAVQTKNRQLNGKLKQLGAEIRQVNEQITGVEHSISKKRSKIERNQTTIDTKNKQLESLLANSGGEDLGPLEIQIASLKKSLTEINQHIVEKEQLWLRNQYELVNVSKAKDSKDKALDKIKKEFTIYLQRKLRIEKEIESKEKDRRHTLRSIRNMQNDMLKLNTLLNKERQAENDLKQGNILAENEFVEELKEAELSMIELEKKRENLYLENKKLTSSLLEAERQVMLWEGKTQLAKETRDAIDKEVGQGEIKQMKSEIHRMEVRFSQLMKEQEKLMRESEQIIEQRTSIQIRAEARSKNEKQKSNLTKTAFERQLNEKRKEIKNTLENCQKIENSINLLENEQKNRASELEQKQLQTQALFGKLESVQNDLQRQQDEKNWNVIQISTKQALLKDLQSLSEGRFKLAAKSMDQLQELIQLENEKARNLQNICDRLSEDYPVISSSLRAVSRTLGYSPKEHHGKEEKVVEN